MTKKLKASSTLLYVSLLAFILFVVYVLYINQEVLYTAHDRSEFIYGAPFFHTLMSKPFGLIQYVGAWLTQFFYYPVLGAGLLVAIWALIFYVGVKAFQLQGSASALMILPVACLLVSIVDLGYWIYIFSVRGYWFSWSVGYLVILFLLWAARHTPRKWHLVWYILGFCLYPFLGCLALIFILGLVFTDKLTWREFLGLALLVFTASIWHSLLYSNLKFDDVVFAGIPRFETTLDRGEHLTLPFWILAVVSVFIPLCAKYLTQWFVPVLCSVTGIIFTSSLMYYDKNYIEEMRMVRYAFDDNWKEVLNLAKANKKPTTTMVFLKNIALMNEGGLLERSFKFGNDGVKLNKSDSLHVSLLSIVSPLVYYNYGMINEAIRLNYENGIQTGFSPFYLKMLSRCASAKGDEKIVERYTALLHHHPFYGDWKAAPVTENVNELQKCYTDELTGVENSDSYIVNSISYWYQSNSKLASEQALFFSMLRRDPACFWPSLRKYLNLHQNETFLPHAQEAYILFFDRAPEKKRMMIPVEQSIYERYVKFMDELKQRVKPGTTLGAVGEEMRAEWGDTYWWYYFFGRTVYMERNIVDNEIAS